MTEAIVRASTIDGGFGLVPAMPREVLRRPPFAGMTVVDWVTGHDRPATTPYIGP